MFHAQRGGNLRPLGRRGCQRIWSQTYDRPGNGLFDYEEPIVHAIVDPLPPGSALDAACGTGRHSAYLAARGHRVIGVDSSPDMLDRARVRVPHAQFRIGDLHQLPLPDDHVDLVVCALALSHLADLRPVFTEFVRVLRPGLRVRRCDEPSQPVGDEQAPMADDLAPHAWDDWPWPLLRITPAAAAAAWKGVPAVIVWHFQRPDGPPPPGHSTP